MPPDIVVALITGAATGVPATLAALAALRKASQAEGHVRPNGQGRVPEMNERQLQLLGEIKGKLDTHIDDRRAHLS